MSQDELETSTSKRRAESEDESDFEEEVKRARVEEEEEEGEPSGKLILDAIETINRIQYELNMPNILLDSPESSDHDTPPESDDEFEESESALSQAHALGYAACIRETFRFLESCGVPENDPIYKQLKSRFVGISN
jgi:hypothetical protein